MKLTARCLLFNPSEEHRKIIHHMMSCFCHAKWFAYKRFEENLCNNTFRAQMLDNLVSQKYGLNIRQSKDAIEQARQTIVAQQKLLKQHIEEYAGKVASAERKLKSCKNKASLPGLGSRLEKRQRKLAFYRNHEANHTLPPVLFGGRDNFLHRSRGKISKEEYQAKRNNQFVSRGDRTKKGNPNLRIVMEGEASFLEISTLEYTTSVPCSRMDGTLKKEKRIYRKIRTPLYIPQKLSKKTGRINGYDYRTRLLCAVFRGDAYQVELQSRNGRIYAHVTFEVEEVVKGYTGHMNTLGIDTNPDGLGLAVIDSKGNLIFHHYLKEPELLTARANRRENLCGEIARQVVLLAKEHQCAVAVENLKFMNDRDVKAKVARKTAQFCYRAILTMLTCACKKEGVEIKSVKPQFTSKIGLYKYCSQYGIPIHNGAAMVIARRSKGFKERVPKLYQCFFKKEPKTDNRCSNRVAVLSSEWTNWSQIDKRIKDLLGNGNDPRAFLENKKRIKEVILA